MVNLTKAVTVFIGRRGEYYYRNIEFDVSSSYWKINTPVPPEILEHNDPILRL